MQEAVQIEHLSKEYILGARQREPYVALRDVIAGAFRKKSKDESRKFLALDNVSFSVKHGERLGIIGRNGAGKSTLLKILSRITTPTKGKITLNGRVASLLEVGTGFHPELTGRENIFLNGSLLGMRKAEINSKFDEIVAFAETEKFLDTPVKRYSSGMYVRLAFAVAAHLDPEILIVDEVLAVGDAEFQKKCLGRMKDVAGEGRTVLFVSHNMAAVQNLCDKAIYLKQGKVIDEGPVNSVIETYMTTGKNQSWLNLSERPDRSGNGILKFSSLLLKNNSGEEIVAMHTGENNSMEIHLVNSLQLPVQKVNVSIGIDDNYGQRIALLNNEIAGYDISCKPGLNKIVFNLNRVPLQSGRYQLTLFTSVNGEISDWIQSAAEIQVESGDFYKTGKLPPDTQGNFLMDFTISSQA